MELEARVWYKQRRFQAAKSAALRAADLFEKLGDEEQLEFCRETLRDIKEAINKQSGSRTRNSTNGELLETLLLHTPINSLFSV